jgi:hypothetical protein
VASKADINQQYMALRSISDEALKTDLSILSIISGVNRHLLFTHPKSMVVEDDALLYFEAYQDTLLTQ